MEKSNVAATVTLTENLFRETLLHLQSGSLRSLRSQISDLFSRYKLWVDDIGARHSQTSALSVEARISEAPAVLTQIRELLDELFEVLKDVLDIITGKRENRHIPQGQVTSETPSHPSQSESEGLVEQSEANDLLDIASSCIRNLLKTSILIRHATTRDRFTKALTVSAPLLDVPDINYVTERYPKLNEEGSKWLGTRLGQANAKRRQFLQYSREHSDRLAGPSEDGLSQTKTTASTLDAVKLQTMLGQFADDNNETKSLTSASETSQFTKNELQLPFPSLDVVSSGAEAFQCPFCCRVQSFTEEREWKRHVYADLKAYVCTFEASACEGMLFADSRSWFNHEMEYHRKRWVCVLCRSGPFSSVDRLNEHARDAHSNILVGETNLNRFRSASQCAVEYIAASECPFCDEWKHHLENISLISPSSAEPKSVVTVDPNRFRRHVAHHFEQLSLFVLPRLSEEDWEEEDVEKMTHPNSGADLSTASLSTVNHTGHSGSDVVLPVNQIVSPDREPSPPKTKYRDKMFPIKDGSETSRETDPRETLNIRDLTIESSSNEQLDAKLSRLQTSGETAQLNAHVRKNYEMDPSAASTGAPPLGAGSSHMPPKAQDHIKPGLRSSKKEYVEVFYCCQCGHGPWVIATTEACQDCGSLRCDYCICERIRNFSP
ncbi:hypothetical protein GGR57DRAFT_478199 [Xylariaceae sp. FL1272]|nr:hypothetical protein GGR57DRAFT_478199 [Xylariaceae sp. FL1272]